MTNNEAQNREDFVQIPMTRYTELLRKEWAYDMLRERAKKDPYISAEELLIYGIKKEEE